MPSEILAARYAAGTLEHALAQKIDSKEKWDVTVMGPFAPDRPGSQTFGNGGTVFRSTSYGNRQPWWARREHTRIAHGLYEVSAVMAAINSGWAAQYAVHVSRTDNTMVAYTPSVEAGEADKQVTTTMGKFLRKVFLQMSDAEIQELEQAHRAEITVELKFATTPEDIERVYTTMDGDSGCMRHSAGYFSEDVHPSLAYNAPDMGVAYTELDGVVRSRCVVYMRGDDKRAVRVYGDPVIRRLLLSAGFRFTNLAGCRLRKIPSRNGGDYYVVPYLDGVEGNQGSYDGTYATIDGDYLRLMTGDDAAQLQAIPGHSNSNSYVVCAKSTSARVRLVPKPSNEFTSDVSGITYVGYTHKRVNVWLAHEQRVGVAEARELGGTYAPAQDYIDSEWEFVNYLPGSMPTFDKEYTRYRDTTANRELLGYVHLSEKYYPVSDWVLRRICLVTPEGFILRGDAVRVLDVGKDYYEHKSQVAALRKQGFVRGADEATVSVYLSKARDTVHRSDKGIWFDTDLHDDRFVECFTGEWVSKRSAQRIRVFSTNLWAKGAANHETPAVYLAAFKKSRWHMDPQVALESCATGDEAVAATLITHAGSLCQAAMRSEYSVTPQLVPTDDLTGLGEIGYYSTTKNSNPQWSDFLAVAEQVRRVTLGARTDADTLMRMTVMTETLRDYYADMIATMKALTVQREAEAQGQLRVDETEGEPA